jgi:calcium channel MID1
MSFCKSAAYAVPGNPNTFPAVTNLAAFYDNYAKSQYRFFQNALAQIPCEIESTSQYSLARTCDDCAAAYKDWLCSVLIPRCKDHSSTKSWLHERNLVQAYPNGTMLPDSIVQAARNVMYLNSSRNPNIDDVVKPGPYKEVLPCDYLCYNLVQSCPAAMGFSCPRPGMMGFNHSYGLKPNSSADQFGEITCNYPGAVYALGAGSRTEIGLMWSMLAMCILGAFLI